MRIASLEIENFKGVRFAAATPLDDLPIVTMSGRNGVGKSLILEAIFLTWQGEISDPPAASRRRAQTPGQPVPRTLVGPWAPKGRVRLVLGFSAIEWIRIHQFGLQLGIPVSLSSREIALTLEFDKLENYSVTTDDTDTNCAGKVLLDHRFRDTNTFAQIDFMPADRHLQQMELTTLDSNALSDHGAETLRQSVLTSVLNKQMAFNMPGVGSYLAALDYASHLKHRRADVSNTDDDFDAIAESFEAATAKKICRPEMSGDNQIAIFVDAGPGNRHSLSQLSSGEQEALGLMYVVRRLGSQGGILLIDEPEQHLHPSLQRSLVLLVQREGKYSQLWLSTHSPGLITATQTSSLLTVKPAAAGDANQLERLEDDPDRVALLTDLGVPPTLWQHGDYILVVEGSSDERLLTGLLPMEMGKALILVAENAIGVQRMVRALSGKPGVLPWLAIRDRDLGAEDEVAIIQEQWPNLVIWPGRAIENLFLDEHWIWKTVRQAGLQTEESAILARLEELADGDRPEVVRLLTERRLQQSFSATTESRKDLREWYEAQETVARDRAHAFEATSKSVAAEVEGLWGSRWKEWVQGKRILAEFLPATPFRSVNHLEDAMTSLAAEDNALMPEAVTEIRDRLRKLGL